MLLDSAGGSEQLARRHYLAWDPVFRLRARNGVVTVHVGAEDGDGPGLPGGGREAHEIATRARALNDLSPFEGLRAATCLAALEPGLGVGFPEAEALLGLISYDAVRYLERLPDTTRDDLGIPDIDVFLPGRLLWHDLVTGELLLLDRLSAGDEQAAALWARVGDAVARARRPAATRLHGTDMPVFRSNFTRAEYEDVAARAREYVFAGDIFQANLSQRLDLVYNLPSLHLYATLRTVNPSPFAGYLHMGEYELISSSPERLVSLDADGWAETSPSPARGRAATAGPRTTPSPTELNLDPKDRAEHIMLIDLERNDLGRVCDHGTVRVASSWSTSTTPT